MKKVFFLAIAGLFTHTLFAQQSIPFSFKYLPSKIYAVSYKMNMDMNMNVADEAAAKALKDAGQPSSMLMKMNMDMAVDITTEAQKNKTEVPFTMAYKTVGISATMNGQTLPLPQTELKGMRFIGSYSNTTKKIKLDGIEGGTADAAKTAAAEAQLAQIFNQYNFPDTTLKIGDSFEQTVPMSLPTAAGNADVATKIKYTLKEIKGNQALFDLKQVLDMSMNIPQAGGDMVIKGTGAGNMVYDIAANFPVSSDISMDFTYKMNTGGIAITGTMKGLGTTGVQITKK